MGRPGYDNRNPFDGRNNRNNRNNRGGMGGAGGFRNMGGATRF